MNKERMKSRFSKKQIIGILKQQESGIPTAQICLEYGVSGATFYNGRLEFGGMNVGEAQRLRQLKKENAKFKRLVAELNLDNLALKDVLSKKMVMPAVRKQVAGYLHEKHGLSQRRSAALVNIPTCSLQYRSRCIDETPLRERLKELAHECPSWGYKRLHTRL